MQPETDMGQLSNLPSALPGKLEACPTDHDTDVLVCPCPIEADAVQALEARLQRQAGEILDRLEVLLNTSAPIGMAFDGCRPDVGQQAVRVERDSDRVWFVGDLHGDLLALEAALDHIRRHGPEDPIVFLGDYIDDGPDSFPVFVRIAELLLEDRGRIALLVGNHDEGLHLAGERFGSSTEPCEFCDWLNMHGLDPVVGRCGRLAVRLFAQLPRALFFVDGLLAAHGGFPHVDLLPSLREPEDLNRPECLQDFVWLRAHPTVRHRDPNRHSRGCQFGHKDFEAFLSVARERLRLPAERMIRGHDHEDERFAIPPAYHGRLLTINALSHRLEREWPGDRPYERKPCVARGRAGRLPQVQRLEIPTEVVRAIYPPPAEIRP
jgi:hypothetical protein